MVHNIRNLISDWSYLVPLTIQQFKANHPNETVIHAAATKAKRTDNEESISYINWAFSRRGTLILTDKRLVCRDWSIPLEKVKYAEATHIGQGLILKIADNEGNHYQFGLQYHPVWLQQTEFPIKITNEEVQFSWFRIIAQIMVFVGIAIWLISWFFR